MRRTMRYTDSKGRRQTLTREQWHYLTTAAEQHGFPRGWGGLGSTLTVRLLRERGLLMLSNLHQEPDWRVTGLTKLGEQVLARWNESEERGS